MECVTSNQRLLRNLLYPRLCLTIYDPLPRILATMSAMNLLCSFLFNCWLGRTTLYQIFSRTVPILNILTSSAVQLIRYHNNASLHGGNVAVNKTIRVPTRTSPPSSRNLGRNLDSACNMTWHSSMIIRSSRRVCLNRWMNVLPSSPNADSSVINTILAASDGDRPLSHPTYYIPNAWYRRCMSKRNVLNVTITLVVLPSPPILAA